MNLVKKMRLVGEILGKKKRRNLKNVHFQKNSPKVKKA